MGTSTFSIKSHLPSSTCSLGCWHLRKKLRVGASLTSSRASEAPTVTRRHAPPAGPSKSQSVPLHPQQYPPSSLRHEINSNERLPSGNLGKENLHTRRPPLLGGKQGAPKSLEDWKATTDWLTMEMEDGLLDDRTFYDIAKACNITERSRPQATLYHNLGLSKRDMMKLNSRDKVWTMGIPTIRSKLKFLKEEVGMVDPDICKLLVKFPRILEYKSEKVLRPHLEFFSRHGIEQSDMAKVLLRAPSTVALSIERTLEPRMSFLRNILEISDDDVGMLGKLILRDAGTLTMTADAMLQRIEFLQENGLHMEEIRRAVVAHPQVLHYTLDTMQEKLDYLSGIGMDRDTIATVISKLPQLLCLDISRNLRPKYAYLTQEMGGSIDSVATYPAYFSLSLSLRIIPRHQFANKMGISGGGRPFSMSLLKLTDANFVQRCGSSLSLSSFLDFRQSMLSNMTRR